MPPTVASFDVFDTLLTRAVGGPQSLALLLGRRLRERGIVACDPQVFAAARRRADLRGVVIAGGDPPLGRVHRELARALRLAPEAAATLEAAERELEAEVLRPVPGAHALVAAARERGEQVVFVSDTNLTGRELGDLLAEHRFLVPGDRVFASAELRASKRRATLFPVVSDALGVAPAAIRHAGDDPVSDVTHARAAGWRATHRPQARLTRYELALERDRDATGGLGAAFAGASRLARLQTPAPEPRVRALVDVAAGVVAPTLTAWMIDVLLRAQGQGIARLYFLSRDGQVLLDVARRLERTLATGIELRYLHGSRTAWLLAAADVGTRLDALNVDRDFRSVRTVLGSVGLTPQDVADRLPPELREPADWDRGIDLRARAALHAVLERPDVRRLALDRGRELRALLVDYLRQEGWDRPGSAGLVDVGWRGRIVRALAQVAGDAGMARPAGVFYFGVSHEAHEVVGPELAPRLDGWFYDDAVRAGYQERVNGLDGCIEMFCAADEGSAVDYVRRGGRVEPVLGEPPDALRAWGLAHVRTAIAAFADALVLGDDLVDRTADAREAVRTVIELFWTTPTDAEVAAWGAFPLTIDMLHTQVTRMAEPVRIADVVRGTRATGALRIRPIMSWPVGTTRASAPPYRVAFTARRRMLAQAPRVRRRIVAARAVLNELRER